MTFVEARRHLLQEHGIHLNRTSVAGEFRVKRADDDSADGGYFTDDLQDAYDTGLLMARQPRLMASSNKVSRSYPNVRNYRFSDIDVEQIIAGLVNTAIVLKFHRDVQEDDEAWQSIRSLVHRLNGNLDYNELTEEWL